MSIGSLMLFVRGDANAESNRIREVRRSIAQYFLYAVMCVLKLIEAEMYVNRELFTFYTW
jgi:hypothetical protein